MSETISYDPSRFQVRSMAEAKSIILTPEDSTTEQRWATETPYFSNMIIHNFNLQARHKVLDFGCGIGRIPKQLIAKTGCMVVGVDIASGMRSLAPSWVLDDKFMACAPGLLPLIAPMDFAIAIWALQHIPDLDRSLDIIHKALRSFGRLFVVNAHNRCIPVEDGRWHDDKIDVRELLCARFSEIAHGSLDPDKTTPKTSTAAFWGLYERRN